MMDWVEEVASFGLWLTTNTSADRVRYNYQSTNVR